MHACQPSCWPLKDETDGTARTPPPTAATSAQRLLLICSSLADTHQLYWCCFDCSQRPTSAQYSWRAALVQHSYYMKRGPPPYRRTACAEPSCACLCAHHLSRPAPSGLMALLPNRRTATHTRPPLPTHTINCQYSTRYAPGPWAHGWETTCQPVSFFNTKHVKSWCSAQPFFVTVCNKPLLLSTLRSLHVVGRAGPGRARLGRCWPNCKP